MVETYRDLNRVAPVRFGYGLGMERFERFRFSVPAVPLRRGFCVFQYSLAERTVPVPVSVPGKRFRRFRFRVRFLGTQRAPGWKKFILARTHEKTIPPRTKFSFSLEIFILGLKISFSIENFNPGPCFSAVREGPGMKISFSIESFIPY